jgi:hypothetical protein
MRLRLLPVLTIASVAACGAHDASGPGPASGEGGAEGGLVDASTTVETGASDSAVLPESSVHGDDAAGAQDSRISDDGGGAEGGDDACAGGGPTAATNEPTGMTAQLDTGPLTVAPAATGTWTNGDVTFTMYSPVQMTSIGESSSNLVRVPCGSGLRLLYEPSLQGGNSPVRFGASIASPGATTYY